MYEFGFGMWTFEYLMTLDYKPDIHEYDDGIRWVCENGHVEVVKYLISLCKKYKDQFDKNGKIGEWKKIGQKIGQKN